MLHSPRWKHLAMFQLIAICQSVQMYIYKKNIVHPPPPSKDPTWNAWRENRRMSRRQQDEPRRPKLSATVMRAGNVNGAAVAPPHHSRAGLVLAPPSPARRYPRRRGNRPRGSVPALGPAEKRPEPRQGAPRSGSALHHPTKTTTPPDFGEPTLPATT